MLHPLGIDIGFPVAMDNNQTPRRHWRKEGQTSYAYRGRSMSSRGFYSGT
jgi:hypothetical protein